jgi:hypothetical protein
MATISIIRFLKGLVDKNDLDAMKMYYNALPEEGEDTTTIPWDVVFQRVYLHACLRKRTDIVAFLVQVYESMNPIDKIALRQVFPYGRYLLNK